MAIAVDAKEGLLQEVLTAPHISEKTVQIMHQSLRIALNENVERSDRARLELRHQIFVRHLVQSRLAFAVGILAGLRYDFLLDICHDIFGLSGSDVEFVRTIRRLAWSERKPNASSSKQFVEELKKGRFMNGSISRNLKLSEITASDR